MTPKKNVKWMLVALLIGFAAAGALTASASAPDDADDAEVEPAAAVPGPVPGGAAAAPAPVPWQRNLLAEMDVRLIGTAVVDGGASMAVLQLPGGPRFVREGDEISPGVRLVKVWRNRIDVERAGVVQDMRARQSSSGPVAAEAALVQAGAAPERLWETHGRMGRSMYYSHYRQAQN
ncbi:MAG TPA: hypothetical protein VLH09_05195 [Bryobacteraceae bacterium]|nr:hypothetical protein [Bryobacteraceae bacterium]